MKLRSARVTPRLSAGACPGFARAINEGDLATAAACFARDGCLITPDATAVHGRDSIRTVLAQMVAGQTRILVEGSNAIKAGEVVFARERWRVRAGEPEGPSIEHTLSAVLILRWIEGAWKLTIAAPWGWAATEL
ncbi:MAG TPA: nuclear transport factor 2 family protein [Solirubrobacterales bacterium]|nr:nuclear transport factor 2 family protein [Solirubrobacterales bacterium]